MGHLSPFHPMGHPSLLPPDCGTPEDSPDDATAQVEFAWREEGVTHTERRSSIGERELVGSARVGSLDVSVLETLGDEREGDEGGEGGERGAASTPVAIDTAATLELREAFSDVAGTAREP